MSDPYRLSLVVTHADGTTTRWGPDELDAADVPSGLSFTTTSPGGFSDLSCDLLRRIDRAHPDQNLYDNVTVYGPGNEVVWDGRFAQFPRQTGDGYTVSPGAEGWVAHLRDNKTFREIYVDRDLSKWNNPSVQRRINLAGTYAVASGQTSPDATTGSPALEQDIDDNWTTYRPLVENVYDAQGIAIGSVYYAWMIGAGTPIDTADTNFVWAAILGPTDTFLSTDTSGSLRAAGPDTGTLTASTDSRAFAMVQFYYNAAPGGAAGDKRSVFWTCLAVYGNTGLTKHGTASATAAQGVYASDVLAHAIAAGAPLLTVDAGDDPSIEATSIVLDHLVFDTPTTVEEVVKRCNAVHLADWGVQENREFYFRQPDPERLTWTVRLDEGGHLKDDGPAAQDLINGVVVSYTDPSGQRRYAGPTSATGMHVTDDLLEDTSADNAATAHGITQRWDTLELSQPCTDANAVDIGAIYLAQRATPQHRGEAVITGLAQHPTEGPRPSWKIRAGDYIQFVDPIDDSISQPRLIVRSDYDHEHRANTLSLDSTPYTLESLLALLDAQLLNS